MKHLRSEIDALAHKDSELLRSLALVHIVHGGLVEARVLLELARAVNVSDHQVLILLARVQAQMGDRISAAKLVSQAIRLNGRLQEADLTFAKTLCHDLKQ